MGKIRFGSEVYTWFMQGTGRGYDNKLDHMIRVAAEAGYTGIEPMVMEIPLSALGCSKYWLVDCDPAKGNDVPQQHNMGLELESLVCASDDAPELAKSNIDLLPQSAPVGGWAINHFQYLDLCGGRVLPRHILSSEGSQVNDVSCGSPPQPRRQSPSDASQEMSVGGRESFQNLYFAFFTRQRAKCLFRGRKPDDESIVEFAPYLGFPPPTRRYRRANYETSADAFHVSALVGCCCEAVLN